MKNPSESLTLHRWQILLKPCIAAIVAATLLPSITSAAPINTGYNMARLVSQTRQDFQNAYDAGARVVRLPCSTMNLATYNANTGKISYNANNITTVKRMLRWCDDIGLQCIIDPHSMFGSTSAFTLSADSPFWRQPKFGQAWARMWERLAREFKDHSNALYGYSVINEPASYFSRDNTNRAVDINAVYADCIRRIRRIDKSPSLILNFHTDDFRLDVPKGPRYYLAPDDREQSSVRKICYDVHLYWPLEFTHQGINGKPRGVRWPVGKKDDRILRQRMNWVSDWLEERSIPPHRTWVCEFGISSGSNLAWNGNTFQPPNNGDGWLETTYTWIRSKGYNFCVHAWGGKRDFDVRTPNHLSRFASNMLRLKAPNKLRE